MIGVTQRLMHATVRIESVSGDGKVSFGTGFFFGFFASGDASYPVLVTNKHVVAGGVKGFFHVTLIANGQPKYGSHERIEIDDFNNIWLDHPDQKVDLAIAPMGNFLNQMKAAGKEIYLQHLTSALMLPPNQLNALTAMEDVVMVGYPTGIWDTKNNLPVLRRGVTAGPPGLDYEGRKEFLIDCACFPGSSGSPVLILNQGSYPDANGNLTIGNRIIFLGVLYAGPQYTAQGELIVVEVPTAAKPVAFSPIPTNLGLCIKAERILDFEPILNAKGINSETVKQFVAAQQQTTAAKSAA